MSHISFVIRSFGSFFSVYSEIVDVLNDQKLRMCNYFCVNVGLKSHWWCVIFSVFIFIFHAEYAHVSASEGLPMVAWICIETWCHLLSAVLVMTISLKITPKFEFQYYIYERNKEFFEDNKKAVYFNESGRR